jgi:hypothetical protein
LRFLELGSGGGPEAGAAALGEESEGAVEVLGGGAEVAVAELGFGGGVGGVRGGVGGFFERGSVVLVPDVFHESAQTIGLELGE